MDIPGLRPTTDRVRETLFNWLMCEVHNTNCLDLFAGSGALGFESLSRGAKYVQFVEYSRDAADTIQNNFDQLKVNCETTRAALDNSEALKYLAGATSVRFDIVFLDPPFNSDLIVPAAELLEAKSWLSDDAVIYIECDAAKDLSGLPPSWMKRKQAKVGQSAFYLFQKEQDQALKGEIA